MSSCTLSKPLLWLAFQLAYSYIQCTDANWPASYYTTEQVTRIDIQHIVDPVSSSESIGEPLCISEDPFCLLSVLDSSLGCRGPFPTSISVVLEAS